MSSSDQANPTPQSSPVRTAGTSSTTNDMRTMVSGLGLGMIVLCVAFGAFVFKQNRLVAIATSAYGNQAEQIRANIQKPETLKQWEQALNELAQYSKGNPQLEEIFRKYRINISGAGEPAPKAP